MVKTEKNKTAWNMAAPTTKFCMTGSMEAEAFLIFKVEGTGSLQVSVTSFGTSSSVSDKFPS